MYQKEIFIINILFYFKPFEIKYNVFPVLDGLFVTYSYSHFQNFDIW